MPLATGRYLTLTVNDRGDLEIAATAAGRDLLADSAIARVYAFADRMELLFEDIQANSSIVWAEDLGVLGLGLTEAPGIVNGTLYDDAGAPDVRGDLWYFNDYMLRLETDELAAGRTVTYTKLDTTASAG